MPFFTKSKKDGAHVLSVKAFDKERREIGSADLEIVINNGKSGPVVEIGYKDELAENCRLPGDWQPRSQLEIVADADTLTNTKCVVKAAPYSQFVHNWGARTLKYDKLTMNVWIPTDMARGDEVRMIFSARYSAAFSGMELKFTASERIQEGIKGKLRVARYCGSGAHMCSPDVLAEADSFITVGAYATMSVEQKPEKMTASMYDEKNFLRTAKTLIVNRGAAYLEGIFGFILKSSSKVSLIEATSKN